MNSQIRVSDNSNDVQWNQTSSGTVMYESDIPLAETGNLNLCDPNSFPIIDNELTQSIEQIPGTDSSLLELINFDESFPPLNSRCAKKRKITTTSNESSQEPDIVALSCSGLIEDNRDFFEDSYYTPLISGFELNEPQINMNSLSSITSPQTPTSDSHSATDIIVIEPLSEKDNIIGLMSNNVKFARILEASPFGKISNMSVTTNFSKKMIIVKFPKVPNEKLQSLLNVNKMGDCNIQCRKPLSQQLSRGVIGPIGLETTDEELNDYLTGRDCNIVKAKRLLKGNQKTPTLSIMITFKTPTLPENVAIGHQLFAVRAYIPNPWQCFNCQRFGHNASDCKSKPRCMLCSEQHASNSCPYRDEGRVPDRVLKCANCQGNHSSNYGGCCQIKRAREVEKIRATRGVTYKDALVMSGRGEATPALTRKRSEIPARDTVPNTKSVSTQTDSINEMEHFDNEKMISSLSLLMIKMFQCVHGDKIGNKMSAIAELVNSVMGVDVTEELERSVPSASVNMSSSEDIDTPTFNSHVVAERRRDRDQNGKKKIQAQAKLKKKKK